jgi:hypothetical protein
MKSIPAAAGRNMERSDVQDGEQGEKRELVRVKRERRRQRQLTILSERREL